MAKAAGLEGPGPQKPYDDLLTAPAGQDISASVPTIQRASSQYTSLDSRFQLNQQARNYERQYAQLYFYRLVQMRPTIEKVVKAKWPKLNTVRVLDVPEEGEVVVIGTIYKEMTLKPSILDEYTKERALAEQLRRTKFTEPDDKLVLEDEGARVNLTGEGLPPGTCVTGVLAAVRGSVLQNGDFDVKEVCFAGVPPQPPRPSVPSNSDGRGHDDGVKYVALVSGLGLGKEDANLLQLGLLVDYICGGLGGETEESMAAKISRVVIAGGVLHGNAALSQPTAYASVRQQTTALGPIKEADIRLSELACAVPVDVMPGASDPASYSLPQQPLHRCLFPGASGFSTFTRSTNPHSFEIDGVRFLGTSGQNVDDIVRYSDLDDPTEILSKLLIWRHLIPTAPDTLASYPYVDTDPFIIDEAPHVLFAGGQSEFSTGVVRGEDGQEVRVVAVPDFSKSGTMVLVNLNTLEVHPVQFECGMES